jgi:hypothetical protein
MRNKLTAVISNYAPRGQEDLNRLVSQIENLVDKVLIVINDDSCTQSRVKNSGHLTITRANRGMNIGAWSEAIQYCDSDSNVIFLQDECRLVDERFIDVYTNKFSDAKIGMIGESLNPKWNLPWEKLRSSSLNYKLLIDNTTFCNRVDLYLSCFQTWGIHPGVNGTHLRSLVWAFSSQAIKAIKSFPLGLTKEECIASEIGVCKLVNQLGFEFIQSDEKPFTFFEHREWEKHGLHKKLH